MTLKELALLTGRAILYILTLIGTVVGLLMWPYIEHLRAK
jgi:hypothetical protein